MSNTAQQRIDRQSFLLELDRQALELNPQCRATRAAFERSAKRLDRFVVELHELEKAVVPEVIQEQRDLDYTRQPECQENIGEDYIQHALRLD